MNAKKINFKHNMNNSIDYFNFCSANNDLPKLETLTERFSRTFRVTFSNHLRMISNITHNQDKLSFTDWKKENTNTNCMFLLKLKSLNAPIVIKLDRALAYSTIDILTGGPGKESYVDSTKEMTSIELNILKNLGMKIIDDLNIAWSPIHDLKAEFTRTEVNAQFIGSIPDESKMIRVNHIIEFNNNKGALEILYPYSTLFPIRDKLFV